MHLQAWNLDLGEKSTHLKALWEKARLVSLYTNRLMDISVTDKQT